MQMRNHSGTITTIEIIIQPSFDNKNNLTKLSGEANRATIIQKIVTGYKKQK